MKNLAPFLLLPVILFAFITRAAAAGLCGNGLDLPYPGPDKAPLARIWHKGDDAKDAPDCAGLQGRGFTMVMMLTGTLRDAGGTPALQASFGRISGLQGLRYWSASDRRWETLITQASALGGLDPSRKRPDFTAAELGAGRDAYFMQKGNGSYTQVIFHMHTLEASPDRLSVLVENANKINYWFIPLFRPGDIQMLYTFTRAADGNWRYRSLWGVTETGLAATGNHDASYENRAAAMYRHMAGIPSDKEPPLMRENRRPGGGGEATPMVRSRLGSIMPAAGDAR